MSTQHQGDQRQGDATGDRAGRPGTARGRNSGSQRGGSQGDRHNQIGFLRGKLDTRLKDYEKRPLSQDRT